jgi:hypothetical protein
MAQTYFLIGDGAGHYSVVPAMQPAFQALPICFGRRVYGDPIALPTHPDEVPAVVEG